MVKLSCPFQKLVTLLTINLIGVAMVTDKLHNHITSSLPSLDLHRSCYETEGKMLNKVALFLFHN